ncbi:MAG: tetratricopeptide repeat protein [Leptospiraceae bacterium]|nr:tetratricopeptide repeat protein [Leptospiraceae bacterium]
MNKNIFFAKLLLFTVYVSFFISCTREDKLTSIGIELEKQGRLTEALFYYEKALAKNPDYGIANKRKGFILSNSEKSSIPAIFHLEKALKEENSSIPIKIKIIDLLLFDGNYSMIEKYTKDLSQRKDLLELVMITKNCLEKEKDRKKAISELESKQEVDEIKYLYRSISLCFSLGGEETKGMSFAEKFKGKFYE